MRVVVTGFFSFSRSSKILRAVHILHVYGINSFNQCGARRNFRVITPSREITKLEKHCAEECGSCTPSGRFRERFGAPRRIPFGITTKHDRSGLWTLAEYNKTSSETSVKRMCPQERKKKKETSSICITSYFEWTLRYGVTLLAIKSFIHRKLSRTECVLLILHATAYNVRRTCWMKKINKKFVEIYKTL